MVVVLLKQENKIHIYFSWYLIEDLLACIYNFIIDPRNILKYPRTTHSMTAKENNK